MFTGIVDHCGEVESLSPHLGIKSQFKDFVIGESISVDGICLTVIDAKNNIFYCDLSPETINLTTAKNFKIGQKVNLEKSLRLDSLLGGHIVMGHVDNIATVKDIKKYENFWEVSFNSDITYLVKKGSVSINGVSLTVNEVDKNSFSVMLIPHTLERTNLQYLEVGNQVNIEWDYFARYIINYLNQINVKET